MLPKTVMRTLASAIINVVLATGPVFGMQIVADHSTGAWHVGMVGDIAPNDFQKFVDKVKQIPDGETAVVALQSDGGVVGDALDIGVYIREHGWVTVVLPNNACASACAAIWIGGTTRIMSRTAHIGFHQETDYDLSNMEPLGPGATGNAVLGGYYAKMGLSTAAIIWATSHDYRDMAWLTEENAARYGIKVTFLEDLVAGDLKVEAAMPVPAPPANGWNWEPEFELTCTPNNDVYTKITIKLHINPNTGDNTFLSVVFELPDHKQYDRGAQYVDKKATHKPGAWWWQWTGTHLDDPVNRIEADLSRTHKTASNPAGVWQYGETHWTFNPKTQQWYVSVQMASTCVGGSK